jgi:hypothetical protein
LVLDKTDSFEKKHSHLATPAIIMKIEEAVDVGSNEEGKIETSKSAKHG